MNRRRRAFTIVEIMVCAALVAIVFAAVNSGLFTGRKAAEKGLNYLDRLGKINRLLEHCKRALRFATQITPQNGPGTARSYVIKYIEKVEAPGLTRVENEMRIQAKPFPKGTKVTINYENKQTTYQLNDLEFFMDLDKNLATIALTPTKGNRPPIALSLFAPFLNQVSLPPMPGVTGATFPPPLTTSSTSTSNPPINPMTQSQTPPLTQNQTPPLVNTNDATIKTQNNDSNESNSDLLGSSSTFGNSRTDRDNETVDGVNISDIQFTTMSTTHNPTTRSGTQRNGTLMGTHSPADVQETSSTPPSAAPPSENEVLGMDGWSSNLGNQITATSLETDNRPPADEDKENEEAGTTDERRGDRRPPVRAQPIAPQDGEASEVQMFGNSSFGDLDLDNPFGS